MNSYIITLIIWFFIGANLLNIVVIIFSYTGLLYSKYDKEGRIKKKVPLKGFLSTIFGLVIIMILFVFYDYSLFKESEQINYFDILLANFILLFLLELYDALFIDIFVIGLWRPKFLKLKDYYSLGSMRTHVKKQFTIAWIMKIPLLLLSSFCSYIFLQYVIS